MIEFESYIKGITNKTSNGENEDFIERGYFNANQFVEMLEWIYTRKAYHIKIRGWGEIADKSTIGDGSSKSFSRSNKFKSDNFKSDRYDLDKPKISDKIIPFEFQGKILKGFGNSISRLRLIFLSERLKIGDLSIEEDYPFILSRAAFSKKKAVAKLSQNILSRFLSQHQKFIFKGFILENTYKEDLGDEAGFIVYNFESLEQWIQKNVHTNNIELLALGEFLTPKSQQKSILRGTIEDPNFSFVYGIMVRKARIAVDFLQFSELNASELKIAGKISLLNKQESIDVIQIIKRKKVKSAISFLPFIIYVKKGKKKDVIDKIIKVSDLTVSFGKRTIIDKANFSVNKGAILGIIGESGAGKSTTVKAMLGELNYKGKIEIMGVDAKKTPLLAPSIGYVPQDLSLIYHNFTPLENCIHFGRQYGFDENYLTRRSKRIFKDLNIEEVMDHPVGELSGGQKRRVSIAMAMVHDPPLLILDEPTSGLDPMTRFDLWKYLDKINKMYGTTLVIISHYLDEIEYSDTSAVYLKGIGFYNCDTPENLKKSLPGKGLSTEVTLERIDLRAIPLIKKIEDIDEIIQRGERIRILTENRPQNLKEHVFGILEENNIPIYDYEEDVEVDMMDYFTVYSRRLGSGHKFEEETKKINIQDVNPRSGAVLKINKKKIALKKNDDSNVSKILDFFKNIMKRRND